jgi:CubicO group peptidase (beta-lactamase class C family)
MMLTARNWAKFGQFVLDKGANPKEPSQVLLKEELLMQCFEPSAINKSYGLTWWLNGVDDQADGQLRNTTLRDRLRDEALNREADTEIVKDGKKLKVYMAAGLGKQRLYVIPKYDLVVVRFAEPSPQGAAFKNNSFIEPILEALAATEP